KNYVSLNLNHSSIAIVIFLNLFSKPYLERVIANPSALRVKIADVTHNLDLGRIANPTEADFQRIAQYKKVLSQLRAALK
ncbi:hypothetical protein QUB14_09730, partial [Microcoleus sp. B3-D2]